MSTIRPPTDRTIAILRQALDVLEAQTYQKLRTTTYLDLFDLYRTRTALSADRVDIEAAREWLLRADLAQDDNGLDLRSERG